MSRSPRVSRPSASGSCWRCMLRRILHIDMDAFYASVEQRDNPALRGKPLAVGGQPNRRGVVAAASYEARTFGVRSAMSMAKAVELCPSLVIVPPDFSRYKAASTTIFDIYREVTPLVEPLSLDEAYLDVTENSWNEPLATTVAKRLKERIRAETGLTASAGVAPNKFLAKIASGWKKPDGLTVIAPDRVEPFLQQLARRRAVGRRARDGEEAARARHRPARRRPERRRIMCFARRSAAWPTGCVSSPTASTIVRSWRTASTKSSGSENTYPEDLTDLDTIRREIAEMAAHAVNWLERQGSARADRDDQSSLLRLHDHHAEPHGGADARRCGYLRQSAACYWTKQRRDSGRSACWASASTISVQPVERPNRVRRLASLHLNSDGRKWPADCTYYASGGPDASPNATARERKRYRNRHD